MTQSMYGEVKPKCFGVIDNPAEGIAGWNPNDKECAGGLDPTFCDKITGSNIRSRCAELQNCGAVVQSKKLAAARGLIEPRTLLKQPQPVLPQNQQFQQRPMFGQAMTPPVNPALQQMQHQLLQQQQQKLAEQQQAQWQQQLAQIQRAGIGQPQVGMNMGYQQMMPVNYQMPSYLSIAEPVEPGGFWGMFGRTIFRSMGKSIGHSVAHMFDTIPFTHRKPTGNGSGT